MNEPKSITDNLGENPNAIMGVFGGLLAKQLAWSFVGAVAVTAAALVGGYLTIIQIAYKPLEERLSSVEDAVLSSQTNNNDRLISIESALRDHTELVAQTSITLTAMSGSMASMKAQNDRLEKAAANSHQQLTELGEKLAVTNAQIEFLTAELSKLDQVDPTSFDFQYIPNPLPYPDVFSHIDPRDWSVEVKHAPNGEIMGLLVASRRVELTEIARICGAETIGLGANFTIGILNGIGLGLSLDTLNRMQAIEQLGLEDIEIQLQSYRDYVECVQKIAELLSNAE